MQRVRIGLMGLAVVFLLVLLAAAFFGLASGGNEVMRPGAPSGPSGNVAAAAEGDAAPKEPLAELGVAPGGATEVTNVIAPPTGPVTLSPPAPSLRASGARQVQ